MKILTLAELGNELPIPSEKGRESFTFKPWRMPEEKKISEIRNRQKTLGKFVRETFEFMLESFNGAKASTISEGDKKLLFNRMPFANIFYMWIYLRYEALGEKIKMAPMECPHCAAKVKDIEADLNGIEVKCAGYGEDGKPDPNFTRTVDYKLKKPITIGEITIHSIRMGFTPWDAMEKLPANERNFGAIKEAMIAASLVGGLAEESKDVLPIQKDLILAALSKRDIEGYYDLLDAHNGGPVLAMEIHCPHCDNDFYSQLNWSYEYFFSNSSL